MCTSCAGDEDRKRLRVTFNEDAELYDRCRPGYPAALFDDLAKLTGLRASSRVLEIGCGTGQATVPLAERGYNIVAVELGPEMAAVARRRLAQFPHVDIVISAFEDYQLPTEEFDLVISATAFHWIEPEIRMVKSAKALRHHGALAVISTHHIAGGTVGFFVDVQDCYLRFDATAQPGFTQPEADAVPKDGTEFTESKLFSDVTFRRYEWEQTYTTQQYVDLLSTYSPNHAMPANTRQAFFSCIKNLINSRYNGRVTKRYMAQLALAYRL